MKLIQNIDPKTNPKSYFIDNDINNFKIDVKMDQLLINLNVNLVNYLLLYKKTQIDKNDKNNTNDIKSDINIQKI
jgi:hypothetical protein